MMSETFRISNSEMSNPYLNGRIPAEIALNLKELFPEHGDLSYEEVLLQQESVYMSIQANGKNKAVVSDRGEASNRSQFSVQEGDFSREASFESQLSLDEALARSLQVLGDDFEDFHINEHIGSVAGSRESTSRESPPRVMSRNISQDDINPDNMTYEELQSLGDAVGHESRGLPEHIISRLPTFKLKTKLFSKKRNNETCVICFTEYKSGNWLTTLPCAHQYHSKCITPWLKLNKSCPVCQKEVKDE